MSDGITTKHTLANAAKRLLSNRPLSKVSVGDICAECSMSRKSLYYHFRDKYDLITWIFKTEFVDRLPESPAVGEPLGFLKMLAVYFYNNRDYYLNILSANCQNSLTEYLHQNMVPYVRGYLEARFRTDADLNMYAVFFTDAVLTMNVRWLRDYPDLNADQVCEMYENALSGLAYLYNYHYGHGRPPAPFGSTRH